MPEGKSSCKTHETTIFPWFSHGFPVFHGHPWHPLFPPLPTWHTSARCEWSSDRCRRAWGARSHPLGWPNLKDDNPTSLHNLANVLYIYIYMYVCVCEQYSVYIYIYTYVCVCTVEYIISICTKKGIVSYCQPQFLQVEFATDLAGRRRLPLHHLPPWSSKSPTLVTISLHSPVTSGCHEQPGMGPTVKIPSGNLTWL